MLKGKIYKAVGGYFYVRDESGVDYSCLARGKLKKNGSPLLVGDYVLFVPGEKRDGEPGSQGTIEERLPRRNVLYRPTVANLDQLVIVMAIIEPPCDWQLVSRMLVMAEIKDISSVICLNKTDLLTKEELKASEIMVERLPYNVIHTSIFTGEGIDTLKQVLSNKCSVFAGPSGVGKSSLLNKVESSLLLTEGELSSRIKRGKHTTRLAELLMLENGGSVVDTPGFTKLDLSGIEPRHLSCYFPDFRDFENKCEFRNCLHLAEPGCIVKKELGNSINPWRYDHYVMIYEELNRQEFI